MAGVKTVVHVRVDKEVYDKLAVIAADKKLSKTEAISRIICYYAVNNLDYEVSFSDVQKAILQKLQSLSFVTSKIAGSTERTEVFIKSLLHDDQPRFSAAPTELSEESGLSTAAETGRGHDLVDALSILRQFIESAKPSSSFDGKAVMQTKIPTLDFNKLKAEYDRLCMSLNM